MAGLIRKGLRQEGMAADIAAKGEDALWMAGATEYDAIVLDLMLPGIDGFEVCRRLRDDGVWSPDPDADGARRRCRPRRRPGRRGRRLPREALLLRRAARPPAGARQARRRRAFARAAGRATCASTRPSARSGGGTSEIELSAKEFAVLEVFMRRPGEVLSRFQLLEHAWDYEYENRSNIVDSYVRLLRRKIDKPFGTRVDPDRARRRLPAARERWVALSRIPIRLRLTLAFAIAMAILLAALGYFVYARFEIGAQRADRPEPAHPRRRHRLPARAQTAISPSNAKLLGREESFAQVLTPRWRRSTRPRLSSDQHPQLTPPEAAGPLGRRSSSRGRTSAASPERRGSWRGPREGRAADLRRRRRRFARRPKRVASPT